MKPERWQQIDGLLDATLDLDPHRRSVFLNEACACDEELRREVEALLASDERAQSFIEIPALQAAAELLAAPQIHLLAGQTIGHYKILSLLGAGGMGEVYLAHDTRLDRKVAVKLLPQGLAADEIARKRLVREARAAAKLDHPNICAVHEVNEQDSPAFIVMQYVEGETLSNRMQHKRLQMMEVLEIAVQVVDALSEAHSRGIVHRDIKPANIILTARGRVKVLDFGLASQLADTELQTEILCSEPGMIAGTVPYMSPEQVRGEGVDGRSDIFSFGVVLYEMLSGRQPFLAESATATASAIIAREPMPLACYSSDAPANFQRIVSTALCKNREQRYQTARDLFIDLDSLRHRLEVEVELERSQTLREPSASTISFMGGQTAPVNQPFTHAETGVRRPAAASAQQLARSQHLISAIRRHRRAALFASSMVVLIISAVAYKFYFARAVGPIDSIAVLPFVNASNDPDVEYLSDGISEALINSLTELHQLRVIARATAFRYVGKEVDPQSVGRELNVRALLMGRVRLVGSTLNIQADLIDAQTGAQLWGAEYERKSSDVLSIKQAIAWEITEKLRLRLSGADQFRLARHDTTNTDAYQFYLRGRFHWNKRNRIEMQKSVESFQHAVAIDPNYALGYTGLADAYSQLSQFQVSTPRELMPQAKDAALKAISIDDQLSEAHAALGLILAVYDYDFETAERELERAIELNPNYGIAHHYFSRVLTAEGRHQEALAENRRALEIDPVSLPFNWLYGMNFLFAREYDEAIAQLKKTLELDASFEPAREWLIMVYWAKADYAQCIEEITRFHQQRGTPEEASLARDSFARGGWQGYLRTALKNPNMTAYLRTMTYVGLGENDKAFAELDKQFENRTHLPMFIRVEPRLDPLRNDPRYAALVRRMGLEP